MNVKTIKRGGRTFCRSLLIALSVLTGTLAIRTMWGVHEPLRKGKGSVSSLRPSPSSLTFSSCFYSDTSFLSFGQLQLLPELPITVPPVPSCCQNDLPEWFLQNETLTTWLPRWIPFLWSLCTLGNLVLLKGTLRPFLTWPWHPSSLVMLSACSSVDTPSCSSCLQANPPGHHHHHLVTPYTRSPKPPDGLEDNALPSCHTAPTPGGMTLPTLHPLGTPVVHL